MNSWSKFVERFRAIPNGFAFAIATVVSFILAVVCGCLGAFAAMYLYDRGMSKGNDFAVGMGGLCAVGTFTFVVVFTWLQKIHHQVSSNKSLFALFVCLVFPALAAVLSLDDIGGHYLPLVLGDWLAILLFALLSLFVCRRWWQATA